MFRCKNTLVSFDVVEKEFICDLEALPGACCIEGDAGAPIDEEERRKLKRSITGGME